MLLRAQLDQLKCVERRLCLRTGEELADCFLLSLVAFLDRPMLRSFDQIEGGVRCRRSAVNCVVYGRAGSTEDRLSVGPVGLGPLERLVGQLPCECQRLVDELRRLEQPVGDAEVRGLGARQHPVLTQRIRHDHLDCG